MNEKDNPQLQRLEKMHQLILDAAGEGVYGLDANGQIDYTQVEELAREHQPKLIICGTTAYPRTIDFERFREIADSVSAWLLADITHIAGLVITGLHPSSIDHAHITTTCTHKQLYGPRGGLILMGRDCETPGPGDVPLHADDAGCCLQTPFAPCKKSQRENLN